jgi:muscleblind protein
VYILHIYLLLWDILYSWLASMTAASTMSYPSYLSPNTLTMFNINNLLNQKDSRWLQLEVCREFQRQKCTRSDAECKFAHPPANVEVQNGRVTACYDSIKGRCNREKPACKYFHPPQHLKDQLLINGRNHLALKNALAQQMQQHIIPGQVPAVFGAPYLSASLPLAYNPYLPAGQLMSPLLPADVTPSVVSHPQAAAPPTQQQQQQPQQQQPAPHLQQKQRSDRIESIGAQYGVF